ncbi:MAG TPA: zinc ribbon domain-containing protein [Chloroflexota bacterium]
MCRLVSISGVLTHNPLTDIPSGGILAVPSLLVSEGSVPIYEYRCSRCGETFEKLIRTTSGQVEVRCPSCDAVEVDRQVSLFGFSGGSSSGGSYTASYGSGSSCTTGG